MIDICKDTSFTSPFAHFNKYEEFTVEYTLGQGLLSVPLSEIVETSGKCDDIVVDISVWEGNRPIYSPGGFDQIPIYDEE